MLHTGGRQAERGRTLFQYDPLVPSSVTGALSFLAVVPCWSTPAPSEALRRYQRPGREGGERAALVYAWAGCRPSFEKTGAGCRRCEAFPRCF